MVGDTIALAKRALAIIQLSSAAVARVERLVSKRLGDIDVGIGLVGGAQEEGVRKSERIRQLPCEVLALGQDRGLLGFAPQLPYGPGLGAERADA